MKKICTFCGKRFQVSNYVGRAQKYCSRKCFGSAKKETRITKLCPICSTLMRGPISVIKRRKCCSKKCSNMHKKTQDYISRFKKGNIPWNKGKRGLCKCSEETKRKMSLSKRGRKMSSIGREKRSIAVKNKMKEGFVPGFLRDVSPTKPEKVLTKYINQNNLPYKYTGNGKFWITVEGVNINPDFVNTNCKKQYIEVLGCFWHGCKKCYPKGNPNKKAQKLVAASIEKDSLKQSLLAKYGYEVTYIWEHELNDSSFVNKLRRY